MSLQMLNVAIVSRISSENENAPLHPVLVAKTEVGASQ
jgi:uncharacterized protein (DUF736 family)